MTKHPLFAAVAMVVMTLAVSQGFAQDGTQVGSDFFNTLQDMITGNFGFFLGLGITVLGIWTWVIKQQTGAGIAMIIGGVLITLSPSLFSSVRNFVGDAVEATGGTQNLQPGTGTF